MSKPVNRTIWLSATRRLCCDVMYFSQRVPLVTIKRRMHLGKVAAARLTAEPRPSWFALFAKAYGIIAMRHAELRRSYMCLPWPRLFEHKHNYAVMPIERKRNGEDVIFYVPFRDPEKQSIQELDGVIRKHKDEPLNSISFFRTQLWTSRLPWPVRRLMWWLGFNLLGRVRAYFYGTFGITGIGAFGSSCVNVLSPLTTTVTYGVFEPDGRVTVRLIFDHRVMDGALPSRALAELEEVLNGEILEELQRMRTLPKAA